VILHEYVDVMPDWEICAYKISFVFAPTLYPSITEDGGKSLLVSL